MTANISTYGADPELRRRAAFSLHSLYSLLVLVLMVGGCASTSRVVVNSANQNSRVTVVVLHHTTADFQESLDILTLPSSRPVSSHYLVPEPDDPSYSEKRLKLHALVPEEQRAWHAGKSYWAGRSVLNDMSIGIELVNRSYCHNNAENPAGGDPEDPASICFYPDFPIAQIDMLLDLLGEILERHPDIKPTNIIGHADVAPQRKIDPGPRFPWQRLYRLGFGAWYDDETVISYWERFNSKMPSLLQLRDALHTYGYEIELSGDFDAQDRNVVRAFQMHFVPWRVSGTFDAVSAAVLFALIEKYRSPDLERLLQSSAQAIDDSGVQH